jgi:drug/metabolite transporter (DMT)-like permease
MRFVVESTFVLFGLTGVVLYFGLQNLGLVFTSAGNAALIQAGVPAVAAFWRSSSWGSGYRCGGYRESFSRWGV